MSKRSNPANPGVAPARITPPVPNRNESPANEAGRGSPAAPPDWAKLTTMKDDEVFSLANQAVAQSEAVTLAEQAFAASLHFHGKVCAALKRIYTLRLNTRAIPRDTKFTDFYSANAGGKPPGRVLALGNVWNWLVDISPARLTEAQFDKMPVDALERAAAILADARETDGDAYLENAHVKRCVETLNTPPPEGCSKYLKTLRDEQKAATQKGAGKTAATSSAPEPLPGEFGDATITHVVRKAAATGRLPRLLQDAGAELASLKGDDASLLAAIDALQLTVELANKNAAIGAAWHRRLKAQAAAAKPAETDVTASGPAGTEALAAA